MASCSRNRILRLWMISHPQPIEWEKTPEHSLWRKARRTVRLRTSSQLSKATSCDRLVDSMSPQKCRLRLLARCLVWRLRCSQIYIRRLPCRRRSGRKLRAVVRPGGMELADVRRLKVLRRVTIELGLWKHSESDLEDETILYVIICKKGRNWGGKEYYNWIKMGEWGNYL